MVMVQIYFQISEDKKTAFEKHYLGQYVPAMLDKVGYHSSQLLRAFPDLLLDPMEAAHPDYNYVMEIQFDTEENRLKWAASDDHQRVFPEAQALAEKVEYRGFDVIEP